MIRCPDLFALPPYLPPAPQKSAGTVLEDTTFLTNQLLHNDVPNRINLIPPPTLVLGN